MTPKDGNPGAVLTPVVPKAVIEAGNAESGEVSQSAAHQSERHPGSLAYTPAPAFRPTSPEQAAQENREISWIEIKLIGEDDKPLPSQAYKVTLPDDSICEGTLDHEGFARIEGFPPGSCTISFPDLDEDAWKDA